MKISTKKTAVLFLFLFASSIGLFFSKNKIKLIVRGYLATIDIIPAELNADVLYILGGSARSTYRHIQAATALYNSHKTKRILFYSRIEKSKYDPSIGRNLTRNEWIRRELVNGGVPNSDIDSINIEENFFGTFSEAKEVSAYVIRKHYLSAIFLSSPCHSRRISLCVKKFFKDSNVNVYVVGSEDPFYFSELLGEMVKVQVYKILLLF